jgi:hypothetical protein
MVRIAFGLCLLALASTAWPQLAVGTGTNAAITR